MQFHFPLISAYHNNHTRKIFNLLLGLIGIIIISVILWQIAINLTVANPSQPSLTLTIANLLHRIEQLETANQEIIKQLVQSEVNLDKQLRNNRLALAVLHLRSMTQTHYAFISELKLVKQLCNQDNRLLEILTMLEPYATTGVATVAELRDGLGLILIPKLQPLLEDNEQNWFNWAINWMLIPFFSLQPNPRQQLVISATDRLTEDNLRGAVELIEQLDGPAATIVVRWLKEANSRLTVDAAYNLLSEITVAILGQPNI